MTWFRLYHDILSDPKIQRLPAELRWNWIELLCIASKNKARGTLPKLEDIAYLLRMSVPKATRVIHTLIVNRLLEQGEDGEPLRIHDWDEHQCESDSSAERVRRYRERQRNVTSNVTNAVTVTVCNSRERARADSDPDSDSRKDFPPLPLPLSEVPSTHTHANGKPRPGSAAQRIIDATRRRRGKGS